MRYIILFLLFANSFVFAQADPTIKVGLTRSKVIAHIKRDFAFNQYNVMQTESTITVSVNPESQLQKQNIVQYYFTNNILTKSVMIMQVPNPDGMMSFTYQNLSSRYGEPSTYTIDGNKAYHWKMPKVEKKEGYRYYYKDYSDWFQQECFITLITLEPIN